jgi:hypothetical protein
MKWLIHGAILVALGAATVACDEGKSVEGNQAQTQKSLKPPLPKCSLQHPLSCSSTGILYNSPDFTAELQRFLGNKDGYHSVLKGRSIDFHYFGGGSDLKPQIIDGDIIFIDSSPDGKSGQNTAVILKNSRIVAAASQYYPLPYWDENSDLEIFVERRTPESEKWIAMLRKWAVKGQKVHLHEIESLPKERWRSPSQEGNSSQQGPV